MIARVRLFSVLLLMPLVSGFTTDQHLNFSLENMPIREIASLDIPLRVVSRIDNNGRNVELDDGTIWSIVGSDSQTVASRWRLNDSIVLHPTLFPLWAGTPFYLFNERTRTTANATLTANPYADVPTQIQINYIDYVLKRNCLGY